MKHMIVAIVALAWGFGQWSNFDGYKPREGVKRGASLIQDAIIKPG